MSAPATADELVQLIRKSGMVDEQKLALYLRRQEVSGGVPAEARAAADAMVRDGLLTTFQAEQFLLGKWRGFTIGKYKLLERVGVGGMGQVFLCEHLFMKRRVAVKVLPPAKAEHPSALGRFYREARAAGSLEHPNIVRTHDIDQDGNLHFIVMEFVDGSNLLDVVRRFGPLDVGRAVEYARQVALGLDHAFRNGIIHRDIKPGNVMIDRHGTARILDMGLARFYRDQTDLLTVKYDDKVVLGTADYVAPEQVTNSHAVDHRADVYALGATLYFLLAGHPPFPDGTVSQKLLWHKVKDPTPIREVRPEVPEGLAAVIAKMMAKDPAKRYQTHSETAAALAKWVPAEVPLPAAEEMPQLSPLAAGLVQDEAPEAVEPGVAEPQLAVAAPPPEPPRVLAPGSPESRPSSRVDVLLPPTPPPAQCGVSTNGAVAHDATPTDLRRPAAPPPSLDRASLGRPAAGPPRMAIIVGGIAVAVLLAALAYVFLVN
jgi:serine/threonine protein kinase